MQRLEQWLGVLLPDGMALFGVELFDLALDVVGTALSCADPRIARRHQTTVMMPAFPMRCQGRPSTRASSWAGSSGHCSLPGAGQTNLP